MRALWIALWLAATIGFGEPEASNPPSGSLTDSNPAAVYLPALLRGARLPAPVVPIPSATHTPAPTMPPTPTVPTQPMSQLVHQMGGTMWDTVANDDHAFVAVGPRVLVVDVSNPSEPRVIGRTPPLLGNVADLEVLGSHVYAAASTGGLYVVDISAPEDPLPVGRLPARYGSFGVSISSDRAYVGEGGAGVRVVDVSEPTAPVEIAVVALGDQPMALDCQVVGDRLYVLDDQHGLWILGLDDPDLPRALGQFEEDWSVYDGMAILGYHVVLNERYDGIVVVDVTDPTNPVRAYRDPEWDSCEYGRLVAYGQYVLCRVFRDLSVIDVSVPDRPRKVTDVASAQCAPAYVADRKLYCIGETLSIFDLTHPEAPDPLGEADIFTGGGWIAHLADGTSYVSGNDGSPSVIDRADPAEPSFEDRVGWRHDRLLATGGKLVVASEDYVRRSVVVLLDASRPKYPNELTAFLPDSPATYTGHTLLAGNLLLTNSSYGLGGSVLVVHDIAAPETPVRSGSLRLGRIVGDAEVSGDMVLFALTSSVGDSDRGSPGSLSVVDLADPEAPEIVGATEFASSAVSIEVHGRYAFVAVGHHRFGGPTGLAVVDISEPTAPREIAFHPTADVPVGLAFDGRYAYLSTVRRHQLDEQGWFEIDRCGEVRIIDCADPVRPVDVGALPIGGWAWPRANLSIVDGVLWVASIDAGLSAWR